MSKLISISEASEILGVSDRTLRFWDASNFFPAKKTQGGHRRYDLDEVEAIRSVFLKKGDMLMEERAEELRRLCKSEWGKTILLEIWKRHKKQEPGELFPIGTLLVQSILECEYGV